MNFENIFFWVFVFAYPRVGICKGEWESWGAVCRDGAFWRWAALVSQLGRAGRIGAQSTHQQHLSSQF